MMGVSGMLLTAADPSMDHVGLSVGPALLSFLSDRPFPMDVVPGNHEPCSWKTCLSNATVTEDFEMKYGMNLLLWNGDIGEEHYPVLESIKSMGYDLVEIPVFDLEVEKYATLGKKLDELGLERTAVTVRNEDDNPISPDASVRASGVGNNKAALDCCQALGATTLCGPYHSALGIFSGQGPTEDEKKWGADSMRQTAEHAATCGVTLGVEYLNRFECYFINCAEDMVRFVEAVDHPSCRMMYDTFHANLEEKDIPAAIRTASKYTVHVHISENDRSTPGSGLGCP